jgi:Domain of unknown function (DUF6916)
MVDAINAETFRPHVGKTASLSNGHRLTLVAVEVPKSPRADASQESRFVLILRGAPFPVAPEGMYALTFEDGARFGLYVIPIHTPSRDHQDYQVVFN